MKNKSIGLLMFIIISLLVSCNVKKDKKIFMVTFDYQEATGGNEKKVKMLP